MEKIVANVPRRDSFWQHEKSEGRYHVITVANLAATKPEFVPTVVYKDEDERVWSRPLHEFLAKFIPVGGIIRSTIPAGAALDAKTVFSCMDAEDMIGTDVAAVEKVLKAVRKLEARRARADESTSQVDPSMALPSNRTGNP